VEAVDAGVCECSPAVTAAVTKPTPPRPVRAEPTSESHDVHPLAVCEARGEDPLEASRRFSDDGQWEKALSCAAQASALMPNEPLAHAERGRALVALERFDDAKLAYARALAIEPDHLDALLGAAHLYAVALPSTREVDELGVLYAERGFELASAPLLADVGDGGEAVTDRELALEFGRVAAMALNDVGRNAEAIARADWVLARAKDDPEAAFERAIALFERCQFPEAKSAFQRLLADTTRSGHAHYHLGLLLERDGKQAEADKHFARALKASPEHFWTPVMLSPQEFKTELDRLIAALEPEVKKDLTGVPIEVEDLPRLEDLTTGEPPLSPTILGLFRGPPLQVACTPENGAEPGQPCRSIALYRKNLGRAVKTKDELVQQLKVTLLHEIGHLRGEDDGELAARGLE
jgi:tetratricopeptide (TPR) repeat protein